MRNRLLVLKKKQKINCFAMQKVGYLLFFMVVTALVSHFEMSELKFVAQKTLRQTCVTQILHVIRE